jgi:hypothetical protein
MDETEWGQQMNIGFTFLTHNFALPLSSMELVCTPMDGEKKLHLLINSSTGLNVSFVIQEQLLVAIMKRVKTWK